MALNVIEQRQKNFAADKKRRIEEARRALPKPVLAFVEELEKRYAQQGAPIVRDRDRKITEIEKQKTKYIAERDRITGEIDDARSNLENIPISASAGDIATWTAVVNHWPARQGDANKKLHDLQQQINETEKDANAKLRHVQSLLNREIIDTVRALNTIQPYINIHKLVK